MKLRIDGKAISLDPRNALGKGGEADVYSIGNGAALKIYKTPDHPDFGNDPEMKTAAAARIDLAQQKLPRFPRGIHPRIVEPDKLALDTSKRIAGYTMRLISGAEPLYRFGERSFRATAGIGNAQVTAIFRELHGAVRALHRARVVIGDFNDLNVLVENTAAWLIDADSFQFGPFLCPMYTTKFADPLLCDPNAVAPALVTPHTADSDWYAFAVMLFQSLLLVHPYGGMYKPRNPAERVVHDARTMKRITVFNPEIVYPKPAIHFRMLADDTLDYFYRLLVKDERGEVPPSVLDGMEWSVCKTCGAEHARRHCPNCSHAAPASIKTITRVRGTVTATRVFKTDGTILTMALDAGRPQWVYHEAGEFRREDGSVVLRAPLAGRRRVRMLKSATLIGARGEFSTYFADGRVERTAADDCNATPMFESNGQRRYWLSAGQLLRDGVHGQEYIGDVLAGQTHFWAGATFGFGMYRAGRISVAFTFDAMRRGINDRIKLPPIRGELLDCNCTFSDERCWFFAAEHDAQRIVYRCTVIGANGEVIARGEATQGDGSWLGQIHGACAAGPFLFAPTDAGLVRLATANGKIVVEREFPDTEAFVDSSSTIHVSSSGVFAATQKEIQLLTLS